MENLEKLYDAFGELIYVLAMADGIIQEEEYDALEKVLLSHPWAKEIKWSFEYEIEKNSSIEDLYKKVLEICHMHGPRNEYQQLLDILRIVAEASDGIDSNEKRIITNFTRDLTERFKRDLDRLSN